MMNFQKKKCGWDLNAVAAGLHYSSVSKINKAHESGGNSRFKT